MLGETVDRVEELIDSAKPRVAARVGAFVNSTKMLLRQYPARITLTKIAPDLADYNPEDYSIKIKATPSSCRALSKRASGKEGEKGRTPA